MCFLANFPHVVTIVLSFNLDVCELFTADYMRQVNVFASYRGFVSVSSEKSFFDKTRFLLLFMLIVRNCEKVYF